MKIKINNINNNIITKFDNKYSYHFNNLLPTISWSFNSNSNVQKFVKSYVLIMFDPNSPIPNWIHLNIPYIHPDINSIDDINKLIIDNKIYIAKNSWGKFKYNGPAPPSGLHCYVFVIIALNYKFCSSKNNAKNILVNDLVKSIYHNHLNTDLKVLDINSYVTYYYNNININEILNSQKCSNYKIKNIDTLYKIFFS